MEYLQQSLKSYIAARQEAILFDGLDMVRLYNQEISKVLRKIAILRAQQAYQPKQEKAANKSWSFINLDTVII